MVPVINRHAEIVGKIIPISQRFFDKTPFLQSLTRSALTGCFKEKAFYHNDNLLVRLDGKTAHQLEKLSRLDREISQGLPLSLYPFSRGTVAFCNFHMYPVFEVLYEHNRVDTATLLDQYQKRVASKFPQVRDVKHMISPQFLERMVFKNLHHSVTLQKILTTLFYLGS